MPNSSENYNLKLPLQNEYYDVDDFNSNFRIIDTELKELDNKKQDKEDNNLKTIAKIVVEAVNEIYDELIKKATKEQLGRMKVGRNLTVDEDGTVHGNPSYTHPTGNGNNHIPANGASGNFLKWLSSGVAQWASIAWSDITGKPSAFPPSSHTHTKASITDFPTSMKNPNALTISLNGTSQGAYDGSGVKNINITPGSINSYTKQEVDSKVNGRLPSNGKAVDSSKLNGIVNSTGASINTIVQRDSSADILARLFRSNYGDEARMTGAVAFRVNTSDNYIRFCSDTRAFRNWLGLGNVNNWGATSAVNDSSTSKYATAAGVKSAYDRGTAALNEANSRDKVTGKSNGTTGYRIYSDGFKEAWGSLSNDSNEGTKYITLPFTFSTTNYNVSCSCWQDSYLDAWGEVWKDSTSRIKYRTNTTSASRVGTRISWYVCGY